MKTLDITRLSLRNMSLTEVPASLSNLVLYIIMFLIYAVQRSTTAVLQFNLRQTLTN